MHLCGPGHANGAVVGEITEELEITLCLKSLPLKMTFPPVLVTGHCNILKYRSYNVNAQISQSQTKLC